MKVNDRESQGVWRVAWLLIVIVVGVTVYELQRSYRERIQVVFTEADLSSYLASEWIDNSLASIRSILKDSLHGIGVAELSEEPVEDEAQAQINARLAHKKNQYENIIFLGIFDQDCVIRYASIASEVGRNVQELDRDYCRKVMEPPLRKLKFSDLFRSSTGAINISATYPLLSENQGVIGFALAGLNLSFFQRWLDEIESPNLAISIIDTNNILLARKPNTGGVGEPIKDTVLTEFIAGDANSTTFRHKSTVDGVERLWSLRKTGNFPFVVVAGYPLTDSLKAWHNKLIAYSLGNLLMIVMTIFLTVAYQRNRMNAKRMEELADREKQRLIELNKTNEELNDLLKMKDDFLGIASHDIRSPFQGILGFSEMLLEDPKLSQTHKGYVKFIHESAETQLSLVNDILDVLKYESGKFSINPTAVVLLELIAESLNTLRPLFLKKSIQVQNTVDRGITVQADAPKIVQVINNLMTNAVKFSDENGAISIFTEERGDGLVEVHVKDNGVGIEPDKCARLFSRFQQAHENGTKGERGTGLGLAISKNIIDLHGGEIGVRSEPGEGSDFFFTLPRGNSSTEPSG